MKTIDKDTVEISREELKKMFMDATKNHMLKSNLPAPVGLVIIASSSGIFCELCNSMFGCNKDDKSKSCADA